MSWGLEELRERLNNWEEDQIGKANKETRRREEVGGILPTTREEGGAERDLEMKGEKAISDNVGRCGDQSDLSEHRGRY